MRLFLIPESYNGGKQLELTGNDYHYLIRVLRYKKGAEFPGRDRKGNFFDLSVMSISDNQCILGVEESTMGQPELPEIILYQCVCKGKKMDQIIRQVTETGVYSIIPVVSDFSVSKMDTEKPGKIDRWHKIIREAIQQSGSRINTQIGAPVTIDKLAEIDESASSKGKIGLFFHQEALDNSTLHGYLGSNPEKIHLVIGPEGGLSDREIAILYDKNYKSVYLKTNILRAETAALYAVSTVQTLLRESKNWVLKV